MEPPRTTTIDVDHVTGSPVATIALNRPDRLNAITPVMLTELIDVCRWLDDSTEIRAVVVRGRGRAFCAGFDLDAFGDLGAGGDARRHADLGRLAADALTDVAPITIAAVHGHCVGGGLVLAAACDIRLAASDARFSIPEVDLGIPLAWGGIPRLVRELGPAVTKELVLTCRPFGATEALGLRFLNTVVEPDSVLEEAERLAAELAGKPAFSLRATKTHVNAVMDEIAGVGRNANDADSVIAALHDPESRETSRRYLSGKR